MDDGRTIELLSIGVVAEDGREYYAESGEADLSHANDWVVQNVFPWLHVQRQGANWVWDQHPEVKSRQQIASDLLAFAGESPIWWGYFADYDWVVFCQLFGRMIDLPKGWPMYCMDVKQLAVELGASRLPKQDGVEHHALADAIWTRDVWRFLREQYSVVVVEKA